MLDTNLISNLRPHLGRGRKIHKGQKIHASLLLASSSYIPKARPYDDIKWNEFCAYDGGRLELDSYDNARLLVASINNKSDLVAPEKLRDMTTTCKFL